MNPRAPGKAGISYLLYSPQGQMWAHTASHGLPKPSFTSCHWIIFQANPSKKLWKLLLPPQHEMQSLCCPIQLVVTTSAPKNKLWKKEGREEPSELAYVSAFFGLEQEFYHQETPTLWQPRPQQPAKQSTVTQIEVSFKKRWRKKLCTSTCNVAAVQQSGACISPDLWALPMRGKAQNWFPILNWSSVCSQLGLRADTELCLFSPSTLSPPLTNPATADRWRTSTSPRNPLTNRHIRNTQNVPFAFLWQCTAAFSLPKISTLLPQSFKAPLASCELQFNNTYANEISAGKNNYSCSWED